ncbi:phage baseplate assembly protein V [Pseudomonas fluorescens]|jgi:phage baseplate assembly protein V|uniref:Putative phage baseplate assmebly protein V n=3 Tax=Pseudomonas TaxID=286 RepID=A0A220IT53_PSEFL|nr:MULTISPECIES: phage baseplate assembly protein V [Pseudomonas]ASI38043.1 putative phage baseplate assmebly protein V [Pseudomonas fluorescens]OAE16562.1 baseplate assembly protein [Pseudomonas brenneri]AYG09552.1 phage baseplate assembly protein V [Pseudomonas fluorescens]MBJ2268274.1 phage baseplate assembly protein V [Pseudomonas sp. MF6772]MBL7229650.1 phage baseplate assembly protein V [Pseudomonas sp.]
MFDALLRLQLAPIVERLAQMETQLEDLYRRAESFCRIGVCQEVDAASNTCKVRHGELLTPAIRFFNPSAGAQTETRIPTVGEQCLLLNYGGGEGGGQSVALFGLNSDRFPPLSSVASLTSRRYPDGTQSAYDAAGHVLDWSNGPTAFTGSREQVEMSLGAARLVMTAANISVQVGAVGLLLDASGVHLSGPVVDHQGRVISTA